MKQLFGARGVQHLLDAIGGGCGGGNFGRERVMRVQLIPRV